MPKHIPTNQAKAFAIDKELGILDHEIPTELFRATYKGRWEAKFGKLS